MHGRENVPRDISPPRIGRALYVHVPFWVERCRFCYYLAYDDHGDRIDAYLDALGWEARALGATAAAAGRPVSFAYVGGGTPSILSAARTDRLLGSLRDAFNWDQPAEVTVECAPRTVTADKLGVLREHGVTRISLGVQQMDDSVLERSGRIHRVADVERAWRLIDAAGFPVVNLDLIVGLLGETDATFAGSIERVLQMAPESITVYQLEIPESTPLYRSLKSTRTPICWASACRRSRASGASSTRASRRSAPTCRPVPAGTCPWAGAGG